MQFWGIVIVNPLVRNLKTKNNERVISFGYGSYII